MFKKWKDKPWYPMAAALCIAVVLFVFLSNLGGVFRLLRTVLGFFSPVLIGVVFAYFMNPLAGFFYRFLFRRIEKESRRRAFSNGLAFLVFLIIITLALVVILPQLLDSIILFASNLDTYLKAAEEWASKLGIAQRLGIDFDGISNYTKNIVETITQYVSTNISQVINGVANVGRGVFKYFMGFILSIYMLSEKEKLLAGIQKLLKGLISKPRVYDGIHHFASRCNGILNRYVVFNLIDSLIFGSLNALLMLIFGLPYVGLVTFAVALANLVPTFGPIVGAAIGAFVLFLIEPWQALIFLGINIALQMLDAYIIRPKLFGTTLGVSGLWILVGVIVGGRMLGILGILIAIPGVAIIDFMIHDYLEPWLEKRSARMEKDKTEGTAPETDSPADKKEGTA